MCAVQLFLLALTFAQSKLIERVKLIQQRNDQLMQELQPYFPEPIISAEMRAATKSSPKLRNTSTEKSKKDFIKIVVVMCIFALLQGLLTSYFNKYVKV